MGLFNLFGSYSQKELKKIQPTANKVLALEDDYKKLSDAELKAKTAEFKERLSNGETLDDILPEAFATVREAADRVLGMRHYPCQIVGGIILHQGRITEMKTGEGKTFVATLPSYLNALTGKGVHIVTVNDYLAKRDSEWMGKIHRFLGLSVGLIVGGEHNSADRQKAYAADITYGTNNEFGFDYLRDNMAIYKENMVQRGLNFAIVDEVDSILIDEARTPLIISGTGEESDEMYKKADDFVCRLTPVRIKEMEDKEIYDDVDADYIIEEKNKHAVLTARGIEKAQRAFGIENLADYENVELQHYINQALHAHGIMQRDIDYVVKDGEVIIVDEFTGRMMFGRRYSNGLHQAIEAKEHVKIENESKTLASITFQNYFRLYSKLSGMTGTALTEESEFREIYNLDVIEVPTNRPMIRKDLNDHVYKTEKGKFNAVIEDIKARHANGQPVLVGTISIEKSEYLSSLLKRAGIPHNVLNAKHHEKEAAIIAQAGKFGAVTIATNMAGRGTDIILGGNAEFMAKKDMEKDGFTEELISEATGHAETDNEEIIAASKVFNEYYAKHKAEIKDEAEKVRNAGGLAIIGTERHESRRIDNQLRGRAGRQGDPGESRFYLSLEDDLLRLFGGERVTAIAERMNFPEDQPIEMGLISNVIESSQKKLEAMNFARRKKVLEYDDVMNQQRTVIYGQRRKVLDGEDLKGYITKMIAEVVENACNRYLVGDAPEDWDIEGLRQDFGGFIFPKDYLDLSKVDKNTLSRSDIEKEILDMAMERYAESEEANTPEKMREIERIILLREVDSHWMDHIDAMDDLKQGVSLRAYGNKNPVIEYKFESADMFDEMIADIKYRTVKAVMVVRIIREDQMKRKQVMKAPTNIGGEKAKPVVRKKEEKIGRNDLCPCGSGKKYKKCCGANKQ